MAENVIAVRESHYAAKGSKIMIVAGAILGAIGFFVIWSQIVLGAYFILGAALLIFFGIKRSKKSTKSQLRVTDKRVLVVDTKGKQVDIPIGQISAVSADQKGILVVASASGKICFNVGNDCQNLRESISNLIMNYEENRGASSQVIPAQQNNNMDDLV